MVVLHYCVFLFGQLRECCLTAATDSLSYSVMVSASALYSGGLAFESWPGDWFVFHGFPLPL